MEYIKSKDLYVLFNDTLRLWDEVMLNHGFRVAYMMLHMLKVDNKFEEYELADICLLCKYHDIGAYQTDPDRNIFELETKDHMRHSIFGYLFFKYLSPLSDMSKVILHHHTDESEYKDMSEKEIYLTRLIKLADIADVYGYKLGESFNPQMLRKLENVSVSSEALDLYYKALDKYDFYQDLINGDYKPKLKKYLDEYLILSNEETKTYLEMLMYVLGAKKHSYLVNVVTCNSICQHLGEMIGLDERELELLYYASMLHDLGMIYIPSSIIDAPRKLTNEEKQYVQGHVDVARRIMDGKLAPSVLEIISTHHERGDGSGYPRQLKDEQFNDLQRILQVGDVFASLINIRAYRSKMTKNEVISILNEETKSGKLNKEIVYVLIENFDEIYDESVKEQAKVLDTYQRLLNNYEKTCNAV